MSGEFQDANNGKMLYSTMWSVAAPIVPYTNSLCQVYGYTTAMTETFPVQVDPEPFCGVVEAVFENPDILTFQWAWHAATMYDSLKGKTHLWEWPVAEIPNDFDYWIANEYIQLKPVADWKPHGQPLSASGVTRSSRLSHQPRLATSATSSSR